MNSAPAGDKARAALLLRRSSLFRSLPPATIAWLAAHSSALNLARGKQLFGCGERCVGLYTVASGRIALSVSVAAGPGKVIDLIGPGEHLGLAAVVLGANHTAAAEALTDSALILTPREIVLECGAAAGLWPQLAAALGRQVGGLIADIAAFSLNSGRERVAHYLLEIATGRGKHLHPLTLPAKKSVIASRLNLTPETFSRILHDLVVTAAIAVDGRKITILDPVRLRQHDA